MVRSGATPFLDYWVAVRPMPGYCDCGDQYLVATFPDGVLLAVVDGLGHGQEAAVAAGAAVATMAEHAGEPVEVLAQRCNEALKETRGAVMSLASLNRATCMMSWLGIGNVEGILAFAEDAGGGKAFLVPHGGIVGDRLPSLRPATLPLHSGDLLFFASDGINSAFVRDVCYTDDLYEMVHRLFIQHGRSTDDALLLGGRWKSIEMATATVKP